MAKDRSSSNPPDDREPPNQLQVFDFKGNDVRVQNAPDGLAWFLAADVCKALGIQNTTNALGRLDDDERSTLDTIKGGRAYTVNIINESGLYSLILLSRKPEARAFKKWITSVVLPSIRKTGGYQMGQQAPGPDVIRLSVAVSEMQAHLDAQNRKIDVLERLAMLPLRVIPAGFSLLKPFAASHGISFKRGEIISESKKCVRACYQLGLKTVPYEPRDGTIVYQLYPEAALLHWLAGYRNRYPRAGGDLFSASA